MLTYSHVDYITSVESKEVSIPEGERLNFSRWKKSAIRRFFMFIVRVRMIDNRWNRPFQPIKSLCLSAYRKNLVSKELINLWIETLASWIEFSGWYVSRRHQQPLMWPVNHALSSGCRTLFSSNPPKILTSLECNLSKTCRNIPDFYVQHPRIFALHPPDRQTGMPTMPLDVEVKNVIQHYI